MEKVYLVRRYIDNLEDGDWGCADYYYLVGIFKTKEKAEKVMAEEIQKSKAENREDTNFFMFEIDVDKIYEEEDVYLGGGCYIE